MCRVTQFSAESNSVNSPYNTLQHPATPCNKIQILVTHLTPHIPCKCVSNVCQKCDTTPLTQNEQERLIYRSLLQKSPIKETIYWIWLRTFHANEWQMCVKCVEANVWHNSFDTKWEGTINLYVSFEKEPYEKDDILNLTPHSKVWRDSFDTKWAGWIKL